MSGLRPDGIRKLIEEVFYLGQDDANRFDNTKDAAALLATIGWHDVASNVHLLKTILSVYRAAFDVQKDWNTYKASFVPLVPPRTCRGIRSGRYCGDPATQVCGVEEWSYNKREQNAACSKPLCPECHCPTHL